MLKCLKFIVTTSILCLLASGFATLRADVVSGSSYKLVCWNYLGDGPDLWGAVEITSGGKRLRVDFPKASVSSTQAREWMAMLSTSATGIYFLDVTPNSFWSYGDLTVYDADSKSRFFLLHDASGNAPAGGSEYEGKRLWTTSYASISDSDVHSSFLIKEADGTYRTCHLLKSNANHPGKKAYSSSRRLLALIAISRGGHVGISIPEVGSGSNLFIHDKTYVSGDGK